MGTGGRCLHPFRQRTSDSSPTAGSSSPSPEDPHPKTLYQVLATPEWKARLDWSRIVFLFGDERCTPPDHPESNFKMAHTSLFQPLNVHPDHIYRMKGEYEDPAAAAQEYEETIRRLTNSPPPRVPLIDLVLARPRRRWTYRIALSRNSSLAGRQ